MKTALTANHAGTFIHHSAVHSLRAAHRRPGRVWIKPHMNLMLCPKAKDEDGPARTARLKSDSRSNYGSIWLVGTFDRLLKIEMRWGKDVERFRAGLWDLGKRKSGIFILNFIFYTLQMRDIFSFVFSVTTMDDL